MGKDSIIKCTLFRKIGKFENSFFKVLFHTLLVGSIGGILLVIMLIEPGDYDVVHKDRSMVVYVLRTEETALSQTRPRFIFAWRDPSVRKFDENIL